MTEEEVVAIIEKVARMLANRFKFGYHDYEDMKQQACLFAWEGLEKYDGVRNLQSFLWTLVHNQLFNYKRDNFERPNSPCEECDSNKDSECTIYKDDKLECPSYNGWTTRNIIKKNLMLPICLESICDENDQQIYNNEQSDNNAILNEIVDIINKELPIKLRHDYLRLKNNFKLSKTKKMAVREAIRDILTKHGIL